MPEIRVRQKMPFGDLMGGECYFEHPRLVIYNGEKGIIDMAFAVEVAELVDCECGENPYIPEFSGVCETHEAYRRELSIQEQEDAYIAKRLFNLNLDTDKLEKLYNLLLRINNIDAITVQSGNILFNTVWNSIAKGDFDELRFTVDREEEKCEKRERRRNKRFDNHGKIVREIVDAGYVETPVGYIVHSDIREDRGAFYLVTYEGDIYIAPSLLGDSVATVNWLYTISVTGKIPKNSEKIKEIDDNVIRAISGIDRLPDKLRTVDIIAKALYTSD